MDLMQFNFCKALTVTQFIFMDKTTKPWLSVPDRDQNPILKAPILLSFSIDNLDQRYLRNVQSGTMLGETAGISREQNQDSTFPQKCQAETREPKCEQREVRQLTATQSWTGPGND